MRKYKWTLSQSKKMYSKINLSHVIKPWFKSAESESRLQMYTMVSV